MGEENNGNGTVVQDQSNVSNAQSWHMLKITDYRSYCPLRPICPLCRLADEFPLYNFPPDNFPAMKLVLLGTCPPPLPQELVQGEVVL